LAQGHEEAIGLSHDGSLKIGLKIRSLAVKMFMFLWQKLGKKWIEISTGFNQNPYKFRR